MHEHFSHDTRIAWAAGLFEGEGCISPRGKTAVELVVGSTDRDVVECVAEAFGCGSIRVEVRRDGHKNLYRWTVGTRAEVEAVLTAILPWLGERRSTRAREMLARLRENRGASRSQTHCRRGHPFDEANTYNPPNPRFPGERQCLACRKERQRASRAGA